MKKKTTTEDVLTFKKLVFDKRNFLLIIPIAIVCILFIPTLNRPWLSYDERLIFDSVYFITPRTFQEIFEILNNMGLDFNVLSSNPIYSSNYIKRICPLSPVLALLTGFFLKKDPFLYHLLNLNLHIISTTIFYFVLRAWTQTKTTNIFSYCITTLLVTIWAVHPVMMESVLLSTNLGALVSYCFFFAFILDFLINKSKNESFIRKMIIPFVFLIPMLTNEYIVTLPLVLLCISFYGTYQNNQFKSAINITLKECKPYITGLFLYLFIFLIFSKHTIVETQAAGNQLLTTTQRIFWLSPQIFFHSLQLIVFPKILSIDQTLFVRLGKTIFDPYSVFCFLFLASWLLIPLIVFLKTKKPVEFFLICWGFFIALLPFLHIITPSYLLVAERYLYTPLALFIFGLSELLSNRATVKVAPTALFIFGLSKLLPNRATVKVAPTILFVILILCFIRSYYRTLDWKDNYSFINSTYKSTKDPFLKATKLFMLGETSGFFEKNHDKAKQYFKKSINFLETAKKEILPQSRKPSPLVIKVYGLDYNSRLAKIAYLETLIKCQKLNELYTTGLKILEPYIQNPQKLEPNILDLYVHLLLLDKKNDEVKKILLSAKTTHLYVPFILKTLFDLSNNIDNDQVSSGKYLEEALNLFPYEISILQRAILFYEKNKNYPLSAKYSYHFGLLTNSKNAYLQALANYVNINDLKSAGKITSKLLALDPYNPETLYFVSKYYYKIKDYKKALLILQKSYLISKEPNVDSMLAFDIALALAKVNLSLGNTKDAIFLTREISKLTVDDVDSLIKLAKLYKSLGQEEEFNKYKAKILSLYKSKKDG